MIPRHAILKAGQSLYRNDVPFQFSETVGCGMAHARFLDDGAKYTAGPMPPTVGPAKSGINLQFWLKQDKASGPGLTLFSGDPSFQKARLMRAGDAVLQVTDYPQCQRIRVQARLKYGETYNAVELCIPNVKGLSRNYNTNRNGQWSGLVQGTLPDGRVLFVNVLDAKEKFPCGYRFEGANLYLTLYANLESKNVSREGVDDLMAMHTGAFSTSLPPEYVQFLKTDPLISQATQEIPADQQAAIKIDTHVSIELWLSIGEACYPGAPLVLLDGYESPIWSATKPGAGNAGLQVAEQRLLELHKGWLKDGPRGTFLYGDAPEAQDSYVRRRGGQLHYFQATIAWHSFLRTRNADWFGVARAATNHVRSCHWIDGQCSHHKGLLPWSGAFSCNDHAVDAEGLLFAWLCDGDAIALDQWNKWQAAYYPPASGTNSREAVATVRQCDVAYWFTGDAKWAKLSADLIAPVLAENERVKQTDDWKKFYRGMPTGMNWHPLAHKKPLGWNQAVWEGILNVRDLAAQGRLDEVLPLILHGTDGDGNGPLGEAHVLLQMPLIYEYFRGKEVTDPGHHILYGTSKDGRARVFIDKGDAEPLSLNIALGSRNKGDIPGTIVEVFDPTGKQTSYWNYTTDEASRFPRYPVAAEYMAWPDGWQVVHKSLTITGPIGRYRIEVWGYGWVMLNGPLQTKWAEWQSTEGEFSYDGQDASGEWPVGSVMVGN